MDLVYLLKVLGRKKWFLIIVPLLAFVLSFLLTSNMPKEYVSKAQLSTGFTSGETAYYEEDFNIKDANVKFANVIQTMRSPIVVNLLSYKLLIHELNEKPFKNLSEEEFDHINNELGFKFTSKEIDTITSVLNKKLNNFELLNGYEQDEKIIQELLKSYEYNYKNLTESLEIYRLGSSDYIEIRYKSNNPFLSAYVVNNLANEFIKYYDHSKSFKTNNSLNYYAKLLEEKKKTLDSNNQELNQLKTESNIINPGASETKLEQIKEYELKKENYREEINSALIKLEALNEKIENFNNNNNTSSNQRIVELREKINELRKVKLEQENENPEIESTLSQLRQELTYEMSKLSVGQNNTNEDLNDLQNRKDEVELQLKIARNNLYSINRTLNNLRANVTGLASKESIIASKEKEAEKAMEEYLQVLNQYNEEKNKSFITDSSINLIVPGQPSDEPVSSKRLIIMGSATASSLFILIFLIVFREYVDFRIKTPSAFKKTVKLKLIGSINKINIKKMDLIDLFKNQKNLEMETFKEFLRKIRFEVEASSSENNNNTILVTSSKPGEGKTFLILSLAYSLNLLKKKILIIDTNFKNNDLTKLLLPKLHTQQNLLDFKTKLLTDSNFDNADFQTNSIISGTSHQNIDLIGSISIPESPSEIFSGKRFDEMINSLSSQYDYIFLEGAALNEFSDTKELVNYVGKVMAVFSADSTINQKDKESISYLKKLNGKFIGSVLNKVDLKDLEF